MRRSLGLGWRFARTWRAAGQGRNSHHRASCLLGGVAAGAAGLAWARPQGATCQMPKVELHCHLEGAALFDTVVEEASRVTGKVVDNPEEQFLMQRQLSSLSEFLDLFDRIGPLLADEKSLHRITEEVVIAKAQQGVVALELRFAPMYIEKFGLDVDKSMDIIRSAVESGKQKAASMGHPIQVGLICIAIGALGPDAVQRTIDIARRHREHLIGFDVAGGEHRMEELVPLAPEIMSLGLGITIHAGEDRETGLPHNVRLAVEQFGATRIGHGIQSVHDEDVMELLKKRQVHLEVCPWSNYITNAVDRYENHPIRKLHDAGLSLSINTDDPGMFFANYEIGEEYRMVQGTFKFSDPEIFNMNLTALRHSFLPQAMKDEAERAMWRCAARHPHIQTPQV